MSSLKDFERLDLVILDAFMNMKQPYEEPIAEILYLKLEQDVLTISNTDFNEDEDDIFNNG